MLTKVIIADEGEAAAVAATLPSERWQGIDAPGVDPVKLATLWAVLADREFAVESVKEFATLAEDSEEGPWVFRIPRPVRDLLAQLDAGQVRAKARAWAATEEIVRDGWRSADVERALEELGALARDAAARGKPLLMWMSL